MPVAVVKRLYYSQQVKGESPHNLPLFFLLLCRLQAIVRGKGESTVKKNFLLFFWRVSCCFALLRRNFDVLSLKWYESGRASGFCATDSRSGVRGEFFWRCVLKGIGFLFAFTCSEILVNLVTSAQTNSADDCLTCFEMYNGFGIGHPRARVYIETTWYQNPFKWPSYRAKYRCKQKGEGFCNPIVRTAFWGCRKRVWSHCSFNCS